VQGVTRKICEKYFNERRRTRLRVIRPVTHAWISSSLRIGAFLSALRRLEMGASVRISLHPTERDLNTHLGDPRYPVVNDALIPGASSAPRASRNPYTRRTENKTRRPSFRPKASGPPRCPTSRRERSNCRARSRCQNLKIRRIHPTRGRSIKEVVASPNRRHTILRPEDFGAILTPGLNERRGDGREVSGAAERRTPSFDRRASRDDPPHEATSPTDHFGTRTSSSPVELPLDLPDRHVGVVGAPSSNPDTQMVVQPAEA
jgi:hypothetical protein